MISLFRLGWNIGWSNFIRLNNPYKLTFAITSKCNLRCKTCGIWQENSNNELTLDEIKNAFSKTKFPWVNLTGGEPFLHDKLYEIAKIFRKNGFMLSFITNGTIPNSSKVLKKIAELKFPKLVAGVSIDGPKELHDSIRGLPTFDKAISTYKKFRKIKGVGSYIGYTISEFNYGRINETFKAIKSEIPSFKLKEMHFNIAWENDNYLKNMGKMDFNKNAIIQDIKFVLKNKKMYGVIGTMERIFLKFAIKFVKTGKSPLPCKALTSSIFVNPKGTVYPCTGWNHPIGNLKKNSLKIIWKNATSEHKLAKKNKCPQCWTPCEAYQTIYGNLTNLSLIK